MKTPKANIETVENILYTDIRMGFVCFHSLAALFDVAPSVDPGERGGHFGGPPPTHKLPTGPEHRLSLSRIMEAKGDCTSAPEVCGLRHCQWKQNYALVFRNVGRHVSTYLYAFVTQTLSLVDSCTTRISNSPRCPCSYSYSCSSLSLQKSSQEFLQLQEFLAN